MRSLLLREQILTMFKRLELDSVARWIEEKHGGLLAGFAFEADVWLDDEVGTSGLHVIGENALDADETTVPATSRTA